MSPRRWSAGLSIAALGTLILAGCGSSMNDRETMVGRVPVTAAPPAAAPVPVNAEVPRADDEPAAEAEAYDRVRDNPFLRVSAGSRDNRLSTFSIDVDTASYSNMRRFLNQGAWPPKDAVRIEEFLNYFSYNYPQPTGDDPFSIHLEVARCPWKADHRLVRIGLKGKEIAPDRRPNSNLVFLLDVSGSMQPENKLPLVKAALRLLVDRLGEGDRVAIVTYAGGSGLALPSTPCTRKEGIISVIDGLAAGGSTNGGAGLIQANDEATANFIKGGVNRVILCTDGDFNVGVTDRGELVRLVEERAKRGIALSILGFGMGNLKDATMEQLADKGDGNYAYIDTLLEARKHLVEQLSGTLVTIAKDVKVQVEFNPAKVAAYRLIGYENRLLAKEDFNDDTKDAGEIGAGHTVTALYEVVPAGVEVPGAGESALKYELKQTPGEPAKPAAGPAEASPEMMTVALRFKAPEGGESRRVERAVVDRGQDLPSATLDFKFAAAVAEFGMILRDSPHKGNATLAGVVELAGSSLGEDRSGYRKEFVELVGAAQKLPRR
jgi:Ca-activated chloride channel family protein